MRIIYLIITLFFSASTAFGQLPEKWGAPTKNSFEGADRIVLYVPDNANTAIRVFSNLIQSQGFKLDYQGKEGITTDFHLLAKSLSSPKNMMISITAIVSQDTPTILTLSGYTMKDSHKFRNKKSRAEACVFVGSVNQLPKAGFQALIALASTYPQGRVMYLERKF
ncbi:hypothetical protein [Hymenobacter coccineus]|uniref:hypothetical protein n=1 Tax=Hymenobacter coccineus TaxID=1908235 RepID=UPI000F76BEB7|nr:hypothetical protein [Hymenobacter coccineus]